MVTSGYSAAKCILFVIVMGTMAAAVYGKDPAGRVFYAAAPDQFADKTGQPLLIREVGRQAVLMAARDGLGLDTRDEVMGEWKPSDSVPADSAGPPLRIEVQRSTIIISETSEEAAEIGRIHLPPVYKQPNWIDMPSFVQDAESTGQSSALKLLQDAGYSGKPNTTGDGELPAQIDDLLYQTTLMAPLSALQRTHALIRESGESPARLGALARGYANLGVLTRFQWSSIHKVMTARSFLYAQKMVAQDLNSPLPLYHRAYVFALAGYHQAALDDLKRAADLQDQLKTAGEAQQALPPWVALIEPLCKYDITKLQTMVDDDARRAPLAALCCFMDVANCGSVSRLMNIGSSMLIPNPACFAIMDGMSAHAGIASAHGLTEAPLSMMLQSLPKEIKLLPAIPAAVQAAIKAAGQSGDHIANLANVSAAFIGAPEEAEPSYTLAGRIVQETNFVHVERRTYFMANEWDVDCSDYVQQMLPLISGHRFKLYIQSMGHPYATRAQIMGPLEIDDPQFQMSTMLTEVFYLGRIEGKMTGERAYRQSFSNSDVTAYDQEPMLYPFSRTPRTDYELNQARYCRVCSPYSGAAVVVTLRQDWAGTKSHAEEWTTQFQDQPAVLEAIAANYLNDKQLDKAEPLLHKSLEGAPDRETFEELAGLYLSQGNEAKWESTLKQVLAQPDLGLDHAAVDKEIAEHYMDDGKYEKARPFADASSDESGAGWAMEIAARADEYCGDFVAAENQVQAVSQRYGGADWFMWCKRTGKGNLAAATAAVNAWDNQQISEQNTGVYDQIGTVCFLQNRLDDARSYLEQSMKINKQPWDGLMAATICLQQHDSKGRSADLHFVIDNCAGDGKQSADLEFAKLELDAGDQCPPLDQLNKVMKDADWDQTTDLQYFYSVIEEQTGKSENAKKNYLNLLDAGASARWSFVLSCDRLHQMGISDTPLPRVKAKSN